MNLSFSPQYLSFHKLVYIISNYAFYNIDEDSEALDTADLYVMQFK